MAGWALRAEQVEDLSDVAGPDTIVAVGFAEQGRPVVLTTPTEFAGVPFGRTVSPGGASFPRTTTAERYPAKVIMPDGAAVNLADLTLAFPSVQTLPHGELLLVGKRCRRGDDNASIFSTDGSRIRSFCVGDGIESIQTTRSGQIWVSYFDEGVFGNFGWGGDTEPIGASGLVRFSVDGTAEYRFTPPAGLDTIVDCYALNVGEDAVWAYYYTEFDLVRIDGEKHRRAWTTPVSGARAVAIHRDRVLFYGGYGDDASAVHLGRLGPDEVVEIERAMIVGPDGHELEPDLVVGRWRFLHLLVGTTWWRVDLHNVGD